MDLHQYQLVPMQRTCELLSDVCGCELSEGTLTSWMELAAETLAPSMEQIKQGVLASSLQHAAETGVHLGGKLRLPPCEQHRLSHASGVAPQARTRSLRGDWYLAVLSRALCWLLRTSVLKIDDFALDLLTGNAITGLPPWTRQTKVPHVFLDRAFAHANIEFQ